MEFRQPKKVRTLKTDEWPSNSDCTFFLTGKEDATPSMKPTPAVPAQTKDDAYDVFMKEMENFL